MKLFEKFSKPPSITKDMIDKWILEKNRSKLVSALKNPESIKLEQRLEIKKKVLKYLSDSLAYEHIEPIINYLKDDDPEVRILAIKSLSNIGHPKSVNALIEVLKDKDNNVRYSAIEALKEIPTQKGFEAIGKTYDKDQLKTEYLYQSTTIVAQYKYNDEFRSRDKSNSIGVIPNSDKLREKCSYGFEKLKLVKNFMRVAIKLKVIGFEKEMNQVFKEAEILINSISVKDFSWENTSGGYYSIFSPVEKRVNETKNDCNKEIIRARQIIRKI